MSDPRFARLKTDPRFRRPKKQSTKVVVDERFKDIFSTKGKKRQLVDKYGRSLSKNHEQENLRRFYQLEGEAEKNNGEGSSSFPDYARGEVLLESSDEDEDNNEGERVSDDESNTGGVITLGPQDGNDAEVEIDLDESRFAELDAQAAAYKDSHPEDEQEPGSQTRRLAVVNLDWDHVRASHLYKIFASVLSPTTSALSGRTSTSDSTRNKQVPSVVKGRILNVRIYPSTFGKERLAREEKEGPPPEIFKKRKELDPEQINEKTIYELGDGEEYDDDALRKYQLERLRYYYAIVTCDTVEASAHIYHELEGTELERSANIFDLSFVPDEMTFDDEFRDEAAENIDFNYKAVDFVTDALRHSKVKLTWEEDDPERNLVTRRKLSQKEIEESDFKAYLASSSSESEPEDGQPSKKKFSKSASRDKLRSLLLGGEDAELPEGWGMDDGADDVDMEITFSAGLSGAKDGEETTLEKYQRKLRDKKKKRKEELKERTTTKTGGKEPKDEFFDDGSDDELSDNTKDRPQNDKQGKKETGRSVSTAEELALLAAADQLEDDSRHFNMKSVLKAEKAKKGKRGKLNKKKQTEVENELQEDFAIDVKDERFNALHEDHTYAIDPSNPHFKKTKSMGALLDERSRRHKTRHDDVSVQRNPSKPADGTDGGLQALVDRVKRKSTTTASDRKHKRQKP
ncbi:pre-rRNA-processing protein esf1 [Pleurotus pulmonarius]|nr:pre-rRNA-processing protein esf1 [Pleurotus pulmonarius]KAF4606653.1 pre-rRNA-processing protein esf1 [Pleurotus pulmonarius]